MRALPFLILLAGCAGAGLSSAETEADLQRELATLEAGKPETCISARGPGTINPVSASTVTYRDGNILWVNRLRAECPGLRPHDRLLVETQSGQYCRGDHIRSIEPSGGIPGPVCFLGDWVPHRPRS